MLDLIFGDPKNRYHPTAWIGNFIGNLVPLFKNENVNLEKFGGILIVLISALAEPIKPSDSNKSRSSFFML